MIYAFMNFRCQEWEGGDRSITGKCVTCNSVGTLNPISGSTNRYGYCWYNLCDVTGYERSDSYCMLTCNNGTSGPDELYNTCTCTDSFKSYNLDNLGCTCPTTAPKEGSSSCSAPDASETVVELV